MNQKESEQNEVDRMKKGADSTGKVMHIFVICNKEDTDGQARAVTLNVESLESSELAESSPMQYKNYVTLTAYGRIMYCTGADSDDSIISVTGATVTADKERVLQGAPKKVTP